MENATLRDGSNLKGLIPMNLQLHAEGGEETPPEEEQQQEETKTFTEEEFNAKLQSETDKRVSEALKTAKSKWETEYQEEIKKAKDEAEKLAKMNAQEKAEHERDEIKKELEDLRLKDTLNEMGKTARNMLSESEINIPDELLSILVTAEAETTKSNVENFITIFNNAVDKAITEKLKSKPPKRGGGNGFTKEDILKIKDPNERIKMIQENSELFN